MIVNFRQGIISAQNTPTWLVLNSDNTVDINSTTPVILNFSEEDTNYLVKEDSALVTAAWTLPDTNGPYWLYWDIDKETAIKTYGITGYNPFIFVPPTSPAIGQMYYDNTEFRFKEWNGQYWIDVLRLFSGSVSNGVITRQATGSQVAVLTQAVADYIVISTNGLPIKKYGDSTFTFYNKTTIQNFTKDRVDTFQYNRLLDANGTAASAMTIHKCVTWKDYRTLEYADPNTMVGPAFAVLETNVASGDVVSVFHNGFLQDRVNWNWTYPENTVLYVGANGAITPHFDLTFSYQRVGYIVSPNTIYVDFSEYYSYSNHPSYSTTPSPSVTPSITPSISVSSSVVLTATPSPTPSSTLTVSRTISPTPTVSSSVSSTRTPTPTATAATPTPTTSRTPQPTQTSTPTISPPASPSITPTRSVTPTRTAQPTITPTPSKTVSPTVTPTVSHSVSVTPSG